MVDSRLDLRLRVRALAAVLVAAWFMGGSSAVAQMGGMGGMGMGGMGMGGMGGMGGNGMGGMGSGGMGGMGSGFAPPSTPQDTPGTLKESRKNDPPMPRGHVKVEAPTQSAEEAAAEAAMPKVIDVKVSGFNNAKLNVDLRKLTKYVRTRVGRPVDPITVEDDVRRLLASKYFVDAKPQFFYPNGPGRGVVVVFFVVEAPTIRYVKYVGATIKPRHLKKQTGLNVGDRLDPYAVEDGKRKLQDYYLEKGFTKARVTIHEGNKQGDKGVVYVIDEGAKQRIFKVTFEGNTIADDRRLRTVVESRRPILFLFKGEVDRQKIEGDVQKLTLYYRSLGYFQAVIGRELEFNEKQNWLTLKFVIDEGPRSVVRNISFVGNKRYSSAELSEVLKLQTGQFYDRTKLEKDVLGLRDKYGILGYVFSDIHPATRFHEEPGEVDLLYTIDEGERYRVGRVNVIIKGDNPHTRRNTILNRISLHPGDIVDTRLLRSSETRLKRSGLFLNNPADQVEPHIEIVRPEMDMLRREAAADSTGYRGQSPDLATSPRAPQRASRRATAPASARRPNSFDGPGSR